MSKKEYQSAIEACTSLATMSSIQNKLNKLAIKTEDARLKRLLGVTIRYLEQAHRNALPKQRSQKTAFPSGREPAKSLVAYCQAAINSQAPQWMIIARQHGWKPADK